MSWLEKKIHSLAIKRMVAASLVFCFVLFMLWGNGRYFKNFFQGAYTMSAAELAAAPNADALPRYWVNLQAEEILETGFQEITVHKKHGVETSRDVSASYFVAKIGEHLLLVKAHGEKIDNALTGELRHAQGVDHKFLDSPELQEIRSRFYPMVLDTGDFQSNGMIGLAIAAAAILGCLAYGGMAFKYFRNPEKHAIYQNASRWNHPAKVSVQVESELNSGQQTKFGGYIFTRNFVIRDQLLNFDLQKLDDIIWAYKQVTQKKIYYVIPAGKTYALCLNWLASQATVAGKEAQVDAILMHLGQHQPWVLLGHSEELQQAYQKDRNNMAAYVEQQRNAIIQAEEAKVNT